ncbi:LysR family transcriptional regulator [Streptomyces sp. NPDC090493]|uniref:LysR family transcriptional regulator n=1 Tax=Streptomyces sp. NPDC090493 TaxID=3365964 RepID=UPI00382B7B53
MAELRSREVGTLLVMLTVAEHGSINKAAKALFITQPALTRTVQEFETSVGGRIFERTARGVVATPFGEVLLDHARSIRAEAQVALHDAVRAHRDGEQHVRLGVVPCHPVALLSRALDEVTRRHPQVRLHLVHADLPELLEMLRGGSVEAALGPLIDGEDVPQGLQQDVLFYDEIGVYCRAAHPLAGQPGVSGEALRCAAWTLGPMGGTLRARVNALFRKQGLAPPDVRIEVDDVCTRRALVEHTDLLSAFQIEQVGAELKAGSLVRLPVVWREEHEAVGVIRLSPHTALSRSITEILRRVYRDGGLVTPHGREFMLGLRPGELPIPVQPDDPAAVA